MADATDERPEDEPEEPFVDVPFDARPASIALFVGAVLVIAWVAFLAVSAFDVFGNRDEVHAWMLIFNHRPVEWLQWFSHAATAVLGGYTAGQLRRTRYDGVAMFWGLMAIGTGFFLIEDAGDIRHTFRDGVQNAFGDIARWADVFYFALLAAIPLYAIAKYGRHPWRLPGVKPYLATSILVYAIVASANALRFIGDGYERLGARFHDLIADGQLTVPDGWTRELMEFHLIDGPFEESFELIASSMLLAALLATIRAVNDGRRPSTATDRPVGARVDS